MTRTTRRASSALALLLAATVPAVATAHDVRAPQPAATADAGLPTYYDHLGAGDAASRVHKKGIHPQAGQDPGGEHHLPAVNRNVEVVSKTQLTTELGRVSDVSANKGYAYLGAYNEPDCSTGGVWVVDIRDLSAPKRVGFIRSHEDTYTAEGVQAVSLDTTAYQGDLIAYSNENCTSGTTNNGVGGFTLVDVTNPRSPKKLVEGFGDFTIKGRSQRKSNMVHSVLVWQHAGRAYLVAVDDMEDTDVDIFDITNPSKPKLIRETGKPDWPTASSEGFGAQDLFHDVEVRQFGQQVVMIASYWDVGYVKLDVTDPANPKFLADSDVAATDPEFPGIGAPEGNAHQSNWTKDGRYLVATDEDFSPYRTNDLQITTGPNAGAYESQPIGGGGAVTQLPDKRLNGPTVYGGYACPGSAPVPPRSQALPGVLAPGEEAILVVQRGPTGDPGATEEACFPGEKAAIGRAAGYDAVVVAGRHLGTAAADSPPYCGSGGYPTDAPIVSFCIGHGALHTLFNTLPAQYGAYVPAQEPAIGDVGERIDVTAVFDGWGYVQLLDPQTMGNLDTYAVDETKQEANAAGSGDLSVHEVDPDLDDPTRMHYSYYAAGYRATEVVQTADGPRLKEVAAYIDEGGNNFWGVHPLRDTRPGKSGTVVLLSDRDYGLYAVKYRP